MESVIKSSLPIPRPKRRWSNIRMLVKPLPMLRVTLPQPCKLGGKQLFPPLLETKSPLFHQAT